MPLGMIMRHEVFDGMTKRRLSEEDHPAQAFLFYRAHETLRESIQVGRSRRQADDFDAVAHEDAAESIGVFGVPIEDEVSLAAKKPFVNICEIARRLHHPWSIGVRGGSSDVHGPGRDVDKEEEIVRDETPQGQDRPGGVRAVAAEFLILRYQLLFSSRSRQRPPNLTSSIALRSV